MSKLVVLGAGESGAGAAILGKKKGWSVLVSDRGSIKDEYKNVLRHNEIPFEEGKHSEEQILQAEIVVKSPGIPDHVPLIQKLKANGIPVISEIEWAARYCKATLIAITGSNGKTTTTLLTHHLLKKAGLNVGLAGNVGHSFARLVAEKDYDYYVLELSSFQLDGIVEFRPHIAMLLNITPDHLDRYEYMLDRYIDSKFRITMNQQPQDYFIFCEDDENIRAGMQRTDIQAQQIPFTLHGQPEQGAHLADNEIIIHQNGTFKMSIQDLALQGKHNIYNTMASGIAGRILELRKEVIRDSMSDFQNIEHRLEHVTRVHGIDFVNDSKATNVNSTWYALETMGQSVIWIVGGVDKGNDYSMLVDMVSEKVKAIICLGVDNQKIVDAFSPVISEIYETDNMYEAVGIGYRLGSKGDSVLLSPACASFDLFENYEDRGRQFKEMVRSL